ncbi:MAG: NAD(P)H-dependent glycerol-3-phosphate dehydrogenase [Clostridia bacterium]|nr:NAD(P)H-dependent glycerol-3-phosphate dehydrogenase [Clostridia bacterium]
MKNIAIIGSGSWGVALAIHLGRMGYNVKIWSFLKEEADLINIQRKCKFLLEADIPENIKCYTEYKTVVEDSDIIFHVTPSKFTRNIVRQYKEYVKNQPIILCGKGMEVNTLKSLADVVADEIPSARIGVLSGPSHAEEVSMCVPTAIVIASLDEELCNEVQKAIMNENLRVYTSNDVLGVELGGALKNIIAFCAGIVAELKLGDNTFAALATRGLCEISNLGVAMGAKKSTFYGLTGLGDLLVTCLSEHSRNRKAGRLIGRGLPLEKVKEEVGMVIESVDNIEVAYQLSKKYNVEMPIVEVAYKILHSNLEPKKAILTLMTRTKKSE